MKNKALNVVIVVAVVAVVVAGLAWISREDVAPAEEPVSSVQTAADTGTVGDRPSTRAPRGDTSPVEVPASTPASTPPAAAPAVEPAPAALDDTAVAAPEPVATGRKAEVRAFLSGVNPEILQRIDAGDTVINVMLSASTEGQLGEVLANPDIGDYLELKPNNTRIMAPSGVKLGGQINDLQSGPMQGYDLIVKPGLKL